ncbi:MAG TPA: helix-turn-helix domain-containing protein [Candidatus Angelobacter sp.]|jgi:excisionase family DNA binding protein|nr:helix-turn-helix domain-containing protein [Candidatus Angelobacter sp.]
MQAQEIQTNNVSIPPAEQKEIKELYERLRQMEAKLIGPDGKTEVLPNNLYSFLCGLLAELRAGYSVTILQGKAELTTVEAAKLLGMSRQFLVNLLEKGEIPFHKVGTHRRIYARDVLAYKRQRDVNRKKALSDLARAENEEGLYSVPDDFNSGQ